MQIEESRLRAVLQLFDGEPLSLMRQDAPIDWQALWTGQCDAVGRGPEAKAPSDSRPRTVFPGAFNPRHDGHRSMSALARRRLARPVEYELSIANVDKPPLDYVELAARCAQFAVDESVWLTRAPTFVEKSRCFPSSTFIVGADTIARIAELRYYAGNSAAAKTASRDEAIAQIAGRGCRFLVFGRQCDASFESLDTIEIPPALRELCDGVGEADFRADISSTEIRNAGEPITGE
jgi:hypothetical protein